MTVCECGRSCATGFTLPGGLVFCSEQCMHAYMLKQDLAPFQHIVQAVSGWERVN